MALRSSLLAAAGFLAAALHPASLPRPESLKAEFGGEQLQISWSPVKGAALYRVAVFAPVDGEGKRPLQAAVWVKAPRTSYLYGKDTVLAKAGALPSTDPQPLDLRLSYRVMVAAARLEGLDKSPWAATDATATGSNPAFAKPSPTFSPSPSPSATPPASSSDEEAEVVVDADEFQAKPDGAVLDVGEHAEGAESRTGLVENGGPSPESAALSATAVNQSAPLPSDPAAIRALLKSGRADQAESAARALLAKDATDPESWELLGDALSMRKLKVEAMEAYEKSLAIDPKRKHLREWIDSHTRK